MRQLDPGPVRTVHEDFVVGRWYPANAALGRPDLGDELVALVTRLRPLFDSWLGHFGGMPAPKATEHADDPLATEVQRFLDERGYPNAKDRRTLEDRVEFARALTPGALAQFDVGTFRTIINTGRYGGTGPQSYINTTVTNASPEDLERLAASIDDLLWSNDDVASRIDALLEDDQYRVRGLGETIIMKLLAITHPERWVPVFPLDGESGKRAMLRCCNCLRRRGERLGNSMSRRMTGCESVWSPSSPVTRTVCGRSCTGTPVRTSMSSTQTST